MTDVASLNVALGEVHLDDGQVIPITHMFDEDGDDCGPDEAVSCVAGPARDGRWLALDLRMFEPVVEH